MTRSESLTAGERRAIEAMRTAETPRSGVSGPLDNGGMDPVDIPRLWSHVDQSGGPDACWPWTAQRSYMGYGLFRLRDGRRLTASRLVLVLTIGRELGRGYVTCHRCDNPPCCNRRDAVRRMRARA